MALFLLAVVFRKGIDALMLLDKTLTLGFLRWLRGRFGTLGSLEGLATAPSLARPDETERAPKLPSQARRPKRLP